MQKDAKMPLERGWRIPRSPGAGPDRRRWSIMWTVPRRDAATPAHHVPGLCHDFRIL